MTAGELIAQVDALRPNQYSEAEKLRWLRRLDGQLLLELLDSHEGGEEAGQTAEPYDAGTELLCSAPWDEELYTSYLFCQIDLMNAEIEKYNQSAALFAAAWRQLADHLNRSRRPRGERRWKL